jgi:hypothetical protein
MLNNPNFDQYMRIEDIGRIMLVKLRSERDALKLYSDKMKLNLPLVNNKRGNPRIALTNCIVRFIEQNS